MMRIVVVGHGMVGSRFVEEVHRRAAAEQREVLVTVLGDEPYEPYNRLMLSEVIAGRADLSLLTLPASPEGVVVRQGVAAVEVDRERRLVVDAEGQQHAYDMLVFATGADAALPPVPGMRTSSGQGVRAVRTIDDCRELLAATAAGQRMAVLGGGLLGVEIACGLRARGVDVTLLHRGEHVMDRQLDTASGRMAGATLTDLGVDVRLRSGVTRVLRERGQVVGVELPDGEVLAVDVLVVNTGVRPRIELAKAAGVPVDIGILVGDDLRALDDDSVAAIGDCAQTDRGCPGLIAPGWEQAAALARGIVAADGDDDPQADDAEATEELSIVKLKAVGLEMVTLGEPIPDPFVAEAQGLRVVTLSDVGERRSVTVAVRDDRVVAAAIVGSARVAADLTSVYERRTPLPRDPAHLLLKGGSSAGAVPEVSSPTAIPNQATVCRCNGVTKKQIVDAHVEGCRSVEDVAARTRATTGCGGCTATVCGLLEWMDEVDPAASASV